MKKFFMLAAIAAFIAGCGGDGSGQAQTEFKTLPSSMAPARGN